MWERFKRWLQGRPDKAAPAEVVMQAPRPELAEQEPAWVEAADNPFGVRLLDVRPVTLGMLSTSSDPQMASNAVSYGGEDGRSFAAMKPPSSRVTSTTLRYPSPALPLDGAVFIPREMEDKWAIFVQASELIVVRSWQRQVRLRARLSHDGEGLLIGPFEGHIASDDEPPEYTAEALDFLLRTHGLDQPWPAPLAGQPGDPPKTLALQCMSLFGRNAHWASFERPAPRDPPRPLRTVTRLHMGVLRDDLAEVEAALSAGTPIDAWDRFGSQPIHHVQGAGPVLERLLSAGAGVDARSEKQVTPLMLATQDRRAELVEALLSRGARADAADERGFSALHRAAEMGQVAVVKALLARGADPDAPASGGHTPRSLATKRGEQAVLACFSQR